MPNVDYSDIDRLENAQNKNLEEQQKLNNQIVDTSLNQSIARLEKQKADQEKEATKEASGLYTNYKKQSQQYGVNQEQLIAQGLGKSGYAESSKVSLYNQYQANVTEIMNKNNELKAEIDLQMNEAYQNADIQKAQNDLAIYTQKLQLLSQNYQLRYQKYRDSVADEQWEKSYGLQQEQFGLQKQQAEQSQSNWEREYALSLAKANNSSSKSKSSSNGLILASNNENNDLSNLSEKANQILDRLEASEVNDEQSANSVINNALKSKIISNVEANIMKKYMSEYINAK